MYDQNTCLIKFDWNFKKASGTPVENFPCFHDHVIEIKSYH